MNPHADGVDLERKIAKALRGIEVLEDEIGENKASRPALYAIWRRAERFEAEIDFLKRGVEKPHDTAEAFAQLRKTLGKRRDRAVVAPKLAEHEDVKTALEEIAEGSIK